MMDNLNSECSQKDHRGEPALGAVIVEGMRAIQKRQEQHRDPTATREDSGGVRVRVQPDDVKQMLNPSGGQ
jgi:hypothetical protein